MIFLSILLDLNYFDINKLIVSDKTSFKGAISNNEEFKFYLENKIPEENAPILITNKENLKKELENRWYTNLPADNAIEMGVSITIRQQGRYITISLFHER